MLYFISDLHFGEYRIEELFFAKDFNNSVKFYEVYVTTRWNQLVKETDTVVIVGDAGNPNYYHKLIGKKILIRGNHDDYDSKMYTAFDDVTDKLILDIEGYKVGIRHIPKDETGEDIQLCGHVHSVGNYLYIYPDMTRLFLLPNVLGYEPRTLDELLDGRIHNWQLEFFNLRTRKN